MNRYEQQTAKERVVSILTVVTLILLTIALILLNAATAQAFDCIQADGQQGHLNGTTADDAGCITEAEYAELYSVGNLVDTGILTSVVDNGDGTVTAIAYGGTVTLNADPLERPVAATPRLEPDAPTVREVLFPATATRLAALIG